MIIINFYSKKGKKIFDFTVSLIALIILSPFLIIISILVFFKLGKPVLFKQKRPGKNGKIFTLYKYRTMTDEIDNNGELLEDSKRLTTFGNLLRKTSVDELPELINIVKGEMSLVGPRPLSTLYLPYYNEQEKRRHAVLPGLTGLAQIKGRNNLNWEEKFKYDIQYADNVSFMLDLKLILGTVLILFKSNDIVTRGTGKVEDFHVYRQRGLENGDQFD